jgi:hypothetical protein
MSLPKLFIHNKSSKQFLAVILSVLSPALVQQRVLAETVGGVSATAAPVANSSGSVSPTKPSKSSKVHTLPTHMEMESSVRVLLETLPHM